MKTTENNKLIAEFMGALANQYCEFDLWATLYLAPIYEDSDSEDVDVKHFFKPEEMRFHSSWDWLMLVIERIEQVNEGVPSQLINLTLFSELKEVYSAVVEFIKWHNSDNKK